MVFRNCLVLTAFIYQLGVCPCGCWAGNHWVQLACRYVPGLEPYAEQHVAATGFAEVVFCEGDECDHQSRQPYSCNRRQEADDASLAHCSNAPALSRMLSGLDDGLVVHPYPKDTPPDRATLDVRAHLQVFLL